MTTREDVLTVIMTTINSYYDYYTRCINSYYDYYHRRCINSYYDYYTEDVLTVIMTTTTQKMY